MITPEEAVKILLAASCADGGWISESDKGLINPACSSCFNDVLKTLKELLPEVPWDFIYENNKVKK